MRQTTTRQFVAGNENENSKLHFHGYREVARQSF